MNEINKVKNNEFYNKITEILKNARRNIIHTVNKTMVTTYFEIGRMIVEEEQNGKERAEYGKQLIKGLSDKLTKEFNKGFSVTNLKQMKTFYLVYRKGQTVSDQSQKQQRLSVKSVDFQLSWSHYLKLMRIDKQEERKFATSNKGRGGRRKLPYVFTEQGVAMLSAVLRSKKSISKRLTLDIKKFNEQHGQLDCEELNNIHDRFIIIDEKEIYHSGASFKDLGKKISAFSKLEKESIKLLGKIK